MNKYTFLLHWYFYIDILISKKDISTVIIPPPKERQQNLIKFYVSNRSIDDQLLNKNLKVVFFKALLSLA